MNGIINAFTAWSKQFYSDMIHTAQAPNISNIHFSIDFDAQNTHFSIEKLAAKIHFSNSAADLISPESSQTARHRSRRCPARIRP